MTLSELQRHLERRGLRTTQPRLRLLQFFVETDGHFTPEEIAERFRLAGEPIPIATLYQNLRVFSEHGLVGEVIGSGGEVRYDTNLTPTLTCAATAAAPCSTSRWPCRICNPRARVTTGRSPEPGWSCRASARHVRPQPLADLSQPCKHGPVTRSTTPPPERHCSGGDAVAADFCQPPTSCPPPP
ncbi:Fur family transcriptional regulator [Deinococcus radiopugnans]|uniref:Fur family transcriptional regulator n=1 Tax=Deinococcus radiopugnans TaxID=57497 RepID=UPI0036196D6D